MFAKIWSAVKSACTPHMGDDENTEAGISMLLSNGQSQLAAQHINIICNKCGSTIDQCKDVNCQGRQ